jgi:hypothetical protein
MDLRVIYKKTFEEDIDEKEMKEYKIRRRADYLKSHNMYVNLGLEANKMFDSSLQLIDSGAFTISIAYLSLTDQLITPWLYLILFVSWACFIVALLSSLFGQKNACVVMDYCLDNEGFKFTYDTEDQSASQLAKIVRQEDSISRINSFINFCNNWQLCFTIVGITLLSLFTFLSFQ